MTGRQERRQVVGSDGPTSQPDRGVGDGARRIRVRAGFTGLFWPDVANYLAPADREFLRVELVPVAVETFTGTTPEFWHDWLTDENLDDLDGLIVVLDPDGRPAAWVASNQRSFGGRDCFYANSAGVHPNYQGSGLSSAIWRELLRSAVVAAAPRRLYAVMRTANPLVYGAWSAAAGGLDKTWPSPLTDEIPSDVAKIAIDAATLLDQLDRLDPATLVIKNAYDNTADGLWAEPPTSDDDGVDTWMRSILGRKDAIVLVVAFDPVTLLIQDLVRTVRLKLGRGPGRTRSSRRNTASDDDAS